jgi:hypothetical protein
MRVIQKWALLGTETVSHIMLVGRCACVRSAGSPIMYDTGQLEYRLCMAELRSVVFGVQ